MRRVTTTVLAIVLASTASFAVAGEHQGNPAVKARQAHMELYGHNLYYLLGVARGRSEYNAELAQAAADSLVALHTVSQMRYWAPGTDSESVEGSRALPALWENFPTVFGIVGESVAAANALQAVASDGVEAMGPAAQALNQTCNDCHRDFRVRDN